jgi:gluconolactonase
MEGCWAELAQDKDSKTVRVKMKDHAFFIPLQSAGSNARAEGTFQVKTLTKAMVDHMIEEDGAKFPDRNADGTVTEVRNPSFKCNGMVLDADLNLLVCEHVTSSLVRERTDGVRETLAFHWQGKYLNSPNDVTVRSDGRIYFSDPWYGRFPGFGIERERELGWQGVFRIPPGGGQDELDLAIAEDEFEMPNGLCFSPDEKLMYINDTPGAYIKVYDVNDDGTLSNCRMFFEGIGTGVIEEGIPDGMKVDELGNVWVTGPKGLWVISPEGEHLGTIEVPENIGNHSWGGPDWHTLFIPSSSSIYTIRTKVGPRREPYMR